MFARVITAQAGAEGFDNAIRLAQQQLPGARQQPGFQGFYLLTDVDTKLCPGQARGSKPWPVTSARDHARRYLSVGTSVRAGVIALPRSTGTVRDGAGLQAASAGVMVMVQPGLSFSSWRSR
jgi:hypothetical protein